MVKQPFQDAVAAFQEIHRSDPRRIQLPEGESPWSVYYHQRLLYWVRELSPEAPEEMLVAAHSQHLRRWQTPRDRFPAGRTGYRSWRKAAARNQLAETEEILKKVGYSAGFISRVSDFLMKRRRRLDPQVATFEDAICLVFLENELLAFAATQPRSKVIEVLRKTWKKMSQAGQKEALELKQKLPQEAADLLLEALSEES